jgi:hypothetical protein
MWTQLWAIIFNNESENKILFLLQHVTDDEQNCGQLIERKL